MATLQRPMGKPYMPQTFRSPKTASAVASSFFFDAKLPEPHPAGKSCGTFHAVVAALEDLKSDSLLESRWKGEVLFNFLYSA